MWLDIQKRAKENLKREIATLTGEYNDLAVKIETALGGARMDEGALKSVKDSKQANAATKVHSIELARVADVREKKRAILERKEQISEKIALFISEDAGVMRRGFTTEYFHSLKSKRGGVTQEDKEARLMFGILEPDVMVLSHGGPAAYASKRVGEEISSSSASSSSSAPTGGGGGGGGGGGPAAVRVTASGGVDKRFKAGAK